MVTAGGSNEGTDVVSAPCLTWEAEYGITIGEPLDANDCIAPSVTIMTKEAAEVLIFFPLLVVLPVFFFCLGGLSPGGSLLRLF